MKGGDERASVEQMGIDGVPVVLEIVAVQHGLDALWSVGQGAQHREQLALLEHVVQGDVPLPLHSFHKRR